MEEHTSTELLALIRKAATQFGRCCDLYQDGLGGFHCHACGQATFRMLDDVQGLLGESSKVTEKEAYKKAVLQNAAPVLLEAAQNYVNIVNSPSRPRHGIGEAFNDLCAAATKATKQ